MFWVLPDTVTKAWQLPGDRLRRQGPVQLPSADTQSPQPSHSAAPSPGQGAKRHPVQLPFDHSSLTAQEPSASPTAGPAVLFPARCSCWPGFISLFSAHCSHTTKCTVTRFPEAFRCTRPGRLWLAVFPSQG